MADTNQSILIGLDGLGFQEISPWFTDMLLNNLSSNSSKRTSSELTSTTPPWTPCAWPSLLSGQNPGNHGIFDFFTNDGYKKSLIDRAAVDAPYLFEVADANNLVSLSINYPVTHPASRLKNGAVIPGYLATEDVEFSPPELRSEYENEYGEYVIYPNYSSEGDPVKKYTGVARHRRDMACFLNKRYDWDLMAVQFQVTDSIFHDIDDRDQIKQILKNVNDFVGDIIDLGDDDANVFIVSDHGMGDYEWTFYVNSWLAKNGYCETTIGEEQYFRQAKTDLRRDDKERTPTGVASLIGISASALSKVGLSPRRIHQGLGVVGLDKAVEKLLPEDALVAAQNQVVDHENSIAYQLLFNSLGVHLNVKGREPSGQLPPAEYDNVREKLILELSEIRDPEGNLVFDEVLPKERVYAGDHLDDAPDIVLVPRDYQYDVSGSVVDTFRRYQHKNHKPEGILISNRNLEVDPEEGASIYDIAPTIAAALNLPIDNKSDGKVLGPFEASEQTNWDVLAGEYRSGPDDTGPAGDVENRLADLGYME